MTAASPRPTREQVEAALAHVDAYDPEEVGPEVVLAAEVRAHRAELAAVRDLLDRTLADDPLCTCGWSKPCECGIWTPAIAIDDVRRALNGAALPAVPDGEDAVPAMLAEFHQAFGQPFGHGDVADSALRRTLHEEEHAELLAALDAADLAAVAHELADVVYVAYGSAHSLGIPLTRVIAEVHRANMSKIGTDGPTLREDGKLLKPPSFRRADVAAVLAGADGDNDEVRCECEHLDIDHVANPGMGWGSCRSCFCAGFQQAIDGGRNAAAGGEDVLDAELLRMCDDAEAEVENALLATGTREVPMLGTAEVRAAVAAALALPTAGTS